MTNVRRSRGYSWEVQVLEIFEKKGFVVTRLGGTTTTMPDISAHKDNSELIISVECKSTVGNTCLIPSEQIQRCIDWCNAWGLYHYKMVVLAFKFGNKGSGKQREPRQYLKIWNMHRRVVDVICGYDGYCRNKDTKAELWLEDLKL